MITTQALARFVVEREKNVKSSVSCKMMVLIQNTAIADRVMRHTGDKMLHVFFLYPSILLYVFVHSFSGTQHACSATLNCAFGTTAKRLWCCCLWHKI
eukprot:10598252-Ditylum_brightwellii.AAC.1